MLCIYILTELIFLLLDPKPQKATFDEEEEESSSHRAPARTPPAAGKRPPGGMNFGPMLLPGLGGGGLKLKVSYNDLGSILIIGL